MHNADTATTTNLDTVPKIVKAVPAIAGIALALVAYIVFHDPHEAISQGTATSITTKIMFIATAGLLISAAVGAVAYALVGTANGPRWRQAATAIFTINIVATVCALTVHAFRPPEPNDLPWLTPHVLGTGILMITTIVGSILTNLPSIARIATVVTAGSFTGLVILLMA